MIVRRRPGQHRVELHPLGRRREAALWGTKGWDQGFERFTDLSYSSYVSCDTSTTVLVLVIISSTTFASRFLLELRSACARLRHFQSVSQGCRLLKGRNSAVPRLPPPSPGGRSSGSNFSCGFSQHRPQIAHELSPAGGYLLMISRRWAG